ncbi:MAG: CRISPR-associated endonuclease Cas2 [Proteobacteria bacterium]|jgi:CRISPR-associated protein Cas2|nr:CRISPR-associated endonuclease Cas2 [Pseudomonadota bacterium]MDD6547009.1 CRISPR-associated endonuclease Cas2 [Pseudomonadota bacterium]MDY6308806.1 CRISPR-associated endonuclease Cas2 [Oribacterium sp.]
MMVLITYDVQTNTSAGKKRLRDVAKACVNHAQRVQNSVFEADLDYSKFLKLKDQLLGIIDEKTDSLRFYYLGNNWKPKVEHFGVKETYDPEGLILV